MLSTQQNASFLVSHFFLTPTCAAQKPAEISGIGRSCQGEVLKPANIIYQMIPWYFPFQNKSSHGSPILFGWSAKADRMQFL
jgi:hypothetical protein